MKFGTSKTQLHGAKNHLTHERHELVAFLRSRGITDKAVLEAMGKIPREHFLDTHFASRAYSDIALPIGSQQTISQPYTVAYMTQELYLKKGERVLEIGTGSGYQAAVLAELGCQVYTVERHIPLLKDARKRFEAMGYHNIISRGGDGTLGWPEYAPFDAIIVTAGAPDVPEPLVSQLNPNGGRLIIPIGTKSVQKMYLIRKDGEELSAKELPEFRFVPLIGKEGWKTESE
jgi:protein-L-isoaspartate(D-aspartate) O-methyltransferase